MLHGKTGRLEGQRGPRTAVARQGLLDAYQGKFDRVSGLNPQLLQMGIEWVYRDV